MKENVKTIVYNAVVAALYVAFTYITYPLSYKSIQFRFSEIMVLLCFFRKDYIPGLILGCIIANLGSDIPFDWAIGSLATTLACLGICFSKHLAIAIIFPVISNAFIVAAELYFFFEVPFWYSVLTVGAGELAVMVVGYILFMVLRRTRKNFGEIIRANQNIDFKW